MSSPTERSEATRAQEATHASSRYGADDAMEDTASSVALRVSSPSASRARTPNVTFARETRRVRATTAEAQSVRSEVETRLASPAETSSGGGGRKCCVNAFCDRRKATTVSLAT